MKEPLKVVCFPADYYGGDDLETWFEKSIAEFPKARKKGPFKEWVFVHVVPLEDYWRYYSGNTGAQGFRHRKTGLTIPDYCRQTGGCPECWTRTTRRLLKVAEGSPVLRWLVLHDGGLSPRRGL